MMLAFEVAASAFSPRKRPTHTALIDPLSDCRIFDASVGSAKRSSAEPMGPVVRSRWPGRAWSGAADSSIFFVKALTLLNL